MNEVSLETPIPTTHYLDILNETISELDFRGLTDALNTKGWYWRFANYYHDLNIIFPAGESSALGIQVIPFKHKSSLTLGEVLIQTAWSRGLSPRPIFTKYYSLEDVDENNVGFGTVRHESEKWPALHFVHINQCFPRSIMKPPSVNSLELSLRSVSRFDTRDGERGTPFLKAIQLAENIFGVNIKFHRKLSQQFVQVHLEGEAINLVQILDALAYAADAQWEWVNAENIYFTPGIPYGANGVVVEHF